MSPEKPQLLTALGAGMLQDARKPMCQLGQPLQHNEGRVSTLAFAPEGESFATGSQGGTVRVWEVAATLSPTKSWPLESGILSHAFVVSKSRLSFHLT